MSGRTAARRRKVVVAEMFVALNATFPAKSLVASASEADFSNPAEAGPHVRGGFLLGSVRLQADGRLKPDTTEDG